MSVNLLSGVIPFTELFERLMTLARIDSFNNEDFAKGLVNDSYTRNVPRLADWEPLISESHIVTNAAYITGTVSVVVGGTSLTGAGTIWTAGMSASNGWKIKIAGSDVVYSFTRSTDTAATISPSYVASQPASGASYVIWREQYALATDFDRFLRNGSVYQVVGGRTQGDPIPEVSRDEFRAYYQSDPADPIRRVIISGTEVRVNPPPRLVKAYPYDYIRRLAPMREYTVGTVDIAAGSTTVSGTGTLWSTNVEVGMYFRVDAVGRGDSSKWYLIAEVTDNDTIVLASAYQDGIEAAAEYTICSAPTGLPSKFHDFILYDAAVMAVLTQDDPASEGIMSKRNDLLEGLTRDYKARRTNTQYSVDDDGIRT